MPATLRRDPKLAWRAPLAATRDIGVSRHVHAVQIAGIDQRLRHKRFMVCWLDAVASVLMVATAAALVVSVVGMGAVLVSLRVLEANLTGFVALALGLTFAICGVTIRHLLLNGKRSLCAEMEEAVAERNRLQFLR